LATKLIVKNNKNEHAENGSCSIANAASNTTGENYLYNFDYYIQQGLLDATELDNYLYVNGNVLDEYTAQFVEEYGYNKNSPIGYYTYLKILNNQLSKYSKLLTPQLLSRSKTKGDLEAVKEIISAQESLLEEATANFERLTSVSYYNLTPEERAETIEQKIETNAKMNWSVISCEIEAPELPSNAVIGPTTNTGITIPGVGNNIII
jgi:hypothetical protein